MSFGWRNQPPTEQTQMITDGRETKLTPNQLAKILVVQYGEGAYYWTERMDATKFTEKEIELVGQAVGRQHDRILNHLNIATLPAQWVG